MRSMKSIFSIWVIIFLAAETLVSMAYGQSRLNQPRVYQRNPLKNAIKPLTWAPPTKSSYSLRSCLASRIEVRTRGGKAPVKIEYQEPSISASIWTISKVGYRTFLNGRPVGPFHNHNLFTVKLKATDALGHVIKKDIQMIITDFVKPLHLSSLRMRPGGWGIKNINADWVGSAGEYRYNCTHELLLPYRDIEYIVEYSDGTKYSTNRFYIPDLNKGNTIKYFIRYQGGQSNKITIHLPKHPTKLHSILGHEALPLFGTDTVEWLVYGQTQMSSAAKHDIVKGKTGCGKKYLTYEKAYVTKLTNSMPAPRGTYGAKLSRHPQKGQIINLSNHRIQFDWHHLGSGMGYTPVVEATIHEGICSNRLR